MQLEHIGREGDFGHPDFFFFFTVSMFRSLLDD
jgi:hypothetical protein